MDRFQNTGQPDWDWWSRLWPTPEHTLRTLGLERGDRTVEIGCGNGYFALPAARIAAPASVYAVDLDESLLAELERLAADHRIDTVVPIRGDARSLAAHLPEPVDFAMLANAFHGIEDRAAFVEGVVDALALGGRFAVVNWCDRPREETTIGGEPRGPPTDLRIGPDQTRAAVEAAADLTLVDEVDLPPYHYGLVFER
ncbi:class I SAM-dependent methyltransferase [Halorubrum trueperi]|uniref:Class I SAM-dependent methyltransferase n=1 Tax=Halorubrum trueperi TaxID=2004704 RepID=A0ABD5UNH4_9EURY